MRSAQNYIVGLETAGNQRQQNADWLRAARVIRRKGFGASAAQALFNALARFDAAGDAKACECC
jgi:hypothetical protein